MLEFAKAQFWQPTDEDPPALEYLWRWFRQLSNKRELSFGIGPITYQQIEAWSRLCRVEVSPWEVSVIDTLDLHFRNIENEKREEREIAPTVHDMAQDADDLKIAKAAQAARRKAKLNG